ncbi:MAG: aspartyl/asparaginyl beta-hydroxylase domain-containing protein [Microthrixaceae bacterium]
MTAGARIDRLLGRIVAFNNRRVQAQSQGLPNPRSLEDEPWFATFARHADEIRGEWLAFAATGRRLPRLGDLLAEEQGDGGDWQAALLVAHGRALSTYAADFPTTIRALRSIPGLRAALWSRFAPGTELPSHTGHNAGVLRFHLGVECGEHAALSIGDRVFPYLDGQAILFDDTVEHAAWNRGDAPRTTLFCEIERPLTGPTRWLNTLVQRLLSTDRRYRDAERRSAAWNLALN